MISRIIVYFAVLFADSIGTKLDRVKEKCKQQKKRGKFSRSFFKTMKKHSKCFVCKKSSDEIKDLADHFADHRLSEIVRFPCHLCDLKFVKFSTLEKHHQLVHLNKTFCVTNRHFNELNQLRQEVRRAFEIQHKEDSNDFENSDVCSTKDEDQKSTEQESKKQQIFQCPVDGCLKSFHHRSSFIMHEKCVHSDERSFTCEICSKTFKTRSNLNVHIKMHKNQRDHHCHICGQSFFTSSHLKAHVKVHLKDAKYKCDVPECGKMFIHLSSFKKHQNFHSGVKSHHCKVCQRNFAQACHLREHLKIHSNERNHKCHTCEKAFRRPDTLRIHQRTHDS